MDIMINKYDFNFKEILDFLNNYSGHEYKNPDNIKDDIYKKEIENIKENAQKAIKQFKLIGEKFKSYGYTFKSNTASTWLDGSNTKIRNYFWLELKKENKDKVSTSISIFAEKEDNEVRFRVSLEIKDSDSKEEDYVRHNRFLNKLNPENVNFEYFGSRNKNLNLKIVNSDEVREFIDKVKSRENHKLQIGKTISYEKVKNNTSEDIFNIIKDTVMKLEPYYEISVYEDGEGIEVSNLEGKNNISKLSDDKNIILYGPPGTGKTYNTVKYAVAIIEEKNIEDIEAEAVKDGYNAILKRYKEYKDNKQIAFTTFHQSYGYEEFIEGIKPVLDDDSENVKYTIEPGIFKEFCDRAKNSKLRSKVSKDIIPIIEKCSSHEAIKVEENTKKYVFVIDEINRGNISKIFGELITLIETSKRLGMKEEIKTFLPYSKKEFAVPSNVYILGTMNTADRSIALLDTALRRRFKFIEMLPDSNVLENINVEGINIKVLLDRINKRIELLYDREHTIGHAYFMSLVDNSTIENLANIFKNSIIPLLQEYFYEDYKKIQLVLGDNNKEEEFKFIRSANIDKNLFGDTSSLDMELYDTTYEINNLAFDKKESYIKIYSNENM